MKEVQKVNKPWARRASKGSSKILLVSLLLDLQTEGSEEKLSSGPFYFGFAILG